MRPAAALSLANCRNSRASTRSGCCLQWSYCSVRFGGQPTHGTGMRGSGGASGSSAKRVTAQWYGCPAKTPTPRTVAEKATWNWTAKSAPEEMPLIVTLRGSMVRLVTGCGGRWLSASTPSTSDAQNEGSCAYVHPEVFEARHCPLTESQPSSRATASSSERSTLPASAAPRTSPPNLAAGQSRAAEIEACASYAFHASTGISNSVVNELSSRYGRHRLALMPQALAALRGTHGTGSVALICGPLAQTSRPLLRARWATGVYSSKPARPV